MVIEIKEYNSTDEISNTLDKEIAYTKSALGGYLRRLDEIRSLAEKAKRIREIVMKLAGKKYEKENLGEISMGNINIVLDANPLDELVVIESVVRSQQERLLTLQKAREGLKPFEQFSETDGLKLQVIQNNGIPERVLVRIC
ncbi:MAG: hypothetical protein AC479_06095 [miscellaneous Crenarchaeota group-6 archaeon AD8-1]|nr:MAG: hypothetical protein AC479_06095 [miscellaneous Crenarchaeota group-6 archaeon AD8-1]